MDEYDDGDDGFEYDGDWLYVEDDCPLADDLAETQIADPGYAGTNYDIWYDQADYDLYMFWDDVEFGYDEYWDYGGIGVRTDGTKAGQKRKSTNATQLAAKRRKISATHKAVIAGEALLQPTVVFLSHEERKQRMRDAIPVLKQKKGFAFMPDWRTRFSDATSSPTVAMPAEMRKAAESADEDDEEMVTDRAVRFEEEDEIGDEADADDDDAEDEELGLDPDALKTVLMQRLREAGLGGADENAYMETITKMLSGQGGADDAIAELANSLLGKATNDGGEGVSGWLSEQGISLDTAQDDDASSVATAELPEAPPSTLKRRMLVVEESPPDSAIQVSSSGYNSATRTGRKVQFNVPSSADSSQDAVKAAQTSALETAKKQSAPVEEDDDIVVQSAETRDDEADEIVVQTEEEKVSDNQEEPERPTQDGQDAEQPEAEEVDFDSDTIEVRPRTIPEPVERGKSIAEEAEPAAAVKTSPKRKSARKRKAESDSEEEVIEAPAPKRTRAARAKARAAK